MARGQDDYGQYAPTKTIAGMSDAGEMAVRLGSIDSYERKGQVMLLDDCEDNLAKWGITLGGAGAAAALSTDTAKNGAKSIKLTSGNAVGNDTDLERYISRAVAGRIGFEISFTTASTVGHQDFILFTDNGAQWIVAGIRFEQDIETLSFGNAAGGWTVFADDVDPYKYSKCFHQFKFTIDTITGYYIKCMLGAREWDLSEHAMLFGGGIFFNFLGGKISQSTRVVAQPGIAYYDDFILTQNEP